MGAVTFTIITRRRIRASCFLRKDCTKFGDTSVAVRADGGLITAAKLRPQNISTPGRLPPEGSSLAV